MDSISFKAVDFAIQLAVILFAISFHESAHAYAALRLGDPTARDLGRISLNPIRHIDPFGSVLLPILLYFTAGVLFAYAKPTPVRLQNTKNPRVSDIVVSAAGPLSNFLLAVLGLLVLLGIKTLVPGSIGDLAAALREERFASGAIAPVAYVFYYFVRINILLGVFNLIPLPPLDGSWVLASIFGGPVQRFFQAIAPFGFFILILLSFTRVLQIIMVPAYVLFGIVNRALS